MYDWEGLEIIGVDGPDSSEDRLLWSDTADGGGGCDSPSTRWHSLHWISLERISCSRNDSFVLGLFVMLVPW